MYLAALPVGTAPTASSFSTKHLASIDCTDNCKTRQETFKFCDLVQLIWEIWGYPLNTQSINFLWFCYVYTVGSYEFLWTTVMSLFEAPDTFEGTSIPCHSMCHGYAYSVLLTYDCLNKPKPVKQVVVAVMVILSNRCCVWTMYLCMDSMKFV